MMSVLHITNSDALPQLSLRKIRLGPEWDLVQAFSSEYLSRICSGNNNLAVVYEPALASGYPDMVIAEFRADVFTNWTESHRLLQSVDLQIVHHLSQLSGATSFELILQLGISERLLRKSLDRLLNVGMVIYHGDVWRSAPLNEIFALDRLIAIEAKLSNWKVALRQSALNKWFASESYILTPAKRVTERTAVRARASGVGIISASPEGIVKQLPSSIIAPPVSYASWLFNEWIGRSLIMDNGLSN